MTENIPTVCGRCRHRSEIWDWRKLLFKTLKFCLRKLISWEIWQTTNYPVFKVIIWYWKSPGGVSIEQLTLLINWIEWPQQWIWMILYIKHNYYRWSIDHKSAKASYILEYVNKMRICIWFINTKYNLGNT